MKYLKWIKEMGISAVKQFKSIIHRIQKIKDLMKSKLKYRHKFILCLNLIFLLAIYIHYGFFSLEMLYVLGIYLLHIFAIYIIVKHNMYFEERQGSIFVYYSLPISIYIFLVISSGVLFYYVFESIYFKGENYIPDGAQILMIFFISVFFNPTIIVNIASKFHEKIYTIYHYRKYTKIVVSILVVVFIMVNVNDQYNKIFFGVVQENSLQLSDSEKLADYAANIATQTFVVFLVMDSLFKKRKYFSFKNEEVDEGNIDGYT